MNEVTACRPVLFNSVAGRMGLPWRATSRGLALERGVNNVGPMAASAIKPLEAIGVSLQNHEKPLAVVTQLSNFK